jgi:uncharacterized DUF497 family protein
MTKEGFAWDIRKADSNFAKHGISFYEASEVFDDPMLYVFADALHSDHEDRFGVIGRIHDGRIIAVVFTLTENDEIHLISARRAERAEIRFYMKEPDELRDEAVEVSQRDEDDFDLSKVDWSKAHRGPIFTVKRGPEWIRLEDHVRAIFQGDEEVNDALKWIMRDGRYEFDFEKRAARKRGAAEAAVAAPPMAPPVLSDDSSCPRLVEPAGKRRGSRRRS